MSDTVTDRPELTERTMDRMDRLAGVLTSSIVGLGSADVGATIDDLLERIARALDADHARFECVAHDRAPSGLARAWSRPGTTSGGGGAGLTLPVTVAGHRLGALTVGFGDDALEWPTGVAERLQVLADLLVLALQHARPPLEPARTAAQLHALGDDGGFEQIVGDSPALRVAIARVLEVAPTDASVLLLGETGTGKELFARAVHNRSARRGRTFVRVNCAALPATLIESELFGHERGAFTGALSTRQGRFEFADRGTLFLDEIGDLPQDLQGKLLRVLQEGEFERVGSSQPRRVDVRVIAATHHDLEAAVRDGRFRADLYYRLDVYPIVLPPLRDRPEDIPRLVGAYVRRRQRALNRAFTHIPASVLGALRRHPWPGNVRELENVIERAMIRSTGGTLLLDESTETGLAAAPCGVGTLEAVERRHIEEALQRCRWRINGAGNAAEILGLHPNTLRFRMKKLGIRRPSRVGVVRDFRRLA